jgi:6-phosphogluconolactonase (cycloisomerase 2 family)
MPPYNRKPTTLSSSDQSQTSRDSISDGNDEDQIFVVSCYSDFSKLAHGPRGKEAKDTLYVYRFKPTDGSMVLLNITGNSKRLINPAFSRFHPRLNVLYTCTEDIEENGKIFAYLVESDGSLNEIGHVDAGGTSTCYLTIDKEEKNLLAVNYWDSTLVTIPLSTETGEFLDGVKSKYDPKYGQGMVAATKSSGGVNHSNNDELTIQQRQADPHSHALVLDPYVGCIAYVPCLGKDLIREFLYNPVEGSIEIELNNLPSGLCTGHPDGPRYLCFHPKKPIVYVVNELSSTVSLFLNKNLCAQNYCFQNQHLIQYNKFPSLSLDPCYHVLYRLLYSM